MPKKTKAEIEQEHADEELRKFKLTIEALGRYGLKPGDTIRFRLKDNPNGSWSSALVRGINKDMSVDCVDHFNGGSRSIKPGGRYDVDVKSIGPRRGVVWTEVKALEE